MFFKKETLRCVACHQPTSRTTNIGEGNKVSIKITTLYPTHYRCGQVEANFETRQYDEIKWCLSGEIEETEQYGTRKVLRQSIRPTRTMRNIPTRWLLRHTIWRYIEQQTMLESYSNEAVILSICIK